MQDFRKSTAVNLHTSFLAKIGGFITLNSKVTPLWKCLGTPLPACVEKTDSVIVIGPITAEAVSWKIFETLGFCWNPGFGKLWVSAETLPQLTPWLREFYVSVDNTIKLRETSNNIILEGDVGLKTKGAFTEKIQNIASDSDLVPPKFPLKEDKELTMVHHGGDWWWRWLV